MLKGSLVCGNHLITGEVGEWVSFRLKFWLSVDFLPGSTGATEGSERWISHYEILRMAAERLDNPSIHLMNIVQIYMHLQFTKSTGAFIRFWRLSLPLRQGRIWMIVVHSQDTLIVRYCQDRIGSPCFSCCLCIVCQLQWWIFLFPKARAVQKTPDSHYYKRVIPMVARPVLEFVVWLSL